MRGKERRVGGRREGGVRGEGAWEGWVDLGGWMSACEDCIWLDSDCGIVREEGGKGREGWRRLPGWWVSRRGSVYVLSLVFGILYRV